MKRNDTKWNDSSQPTQTQTMQTPNKKCHCAIELHSCTALHLYTLDIRIWFWIKHVGFFFFFFQWRSVKYSGVSSDLTRWDVAEEEGRHWSLASYSAGRKRRTKLRKRTVTLDPAQQRHGNTEAVVREIWQRRWFFNVTFFSSETCVMAVMCCHKQCNSPSSRWSNTRNLLSWHPLSVYVTSCFEMLIVLSFFSLFSY